jgi:hypothetical protein
LVGGGKRREDTAATTALPTASRTARRSGYADIMEDFAKLMLAASPANAIQMCQAGLMRQNKRLSFDER